MEDGRRSKAGRSKPRGGGPAIPCETDTSCRTEQNIYNIIVILPWTRSETVVLQHQDREYLRCNLYILQGGQ